MQRIMLATDFSARSERALRRAVLLAQAHGACLDLVHVVDDDRPARIVEHEANDARLFLEDLCQTLRAEEGIDCAIQIVLSDPFAGIVRAVAERAPDLLVIGQHRRHILKDVFVGTTAERTIRSVSCPVLMVNGASEGPYRRVLLTTDLSDNARQALQKFERLGIGKGAVRSVLYVFVAPALRLVGLEGLPKGGKERYLEEQSAEAHRELAGFMAGFGADWADLVVQHQDTTPAHEIQKAAGHLGADLIVVSTQGMGPLARLLLGSVTEQVLRAANVDVLAIPPGRDA